MQTDKPTFIDYCCGCGGFTKGFELAGWDCRGGVDIEGAACETFDYNIDAPIHCGTVEDSDLAEQADAVISGFPCFAAGTLVLTRDGYVPIEDVVEGMDVLTHLGRWRPVTANIRRRADVTRVVDISGVKIKTTDEHPFWVSELLDSSDAYGCQAYGRPRWVAAASISAGDYAAIEVMPPEDFGMPTHRDVLWLLGIYAAIGSLDADMESRSSEGVMLHCDIEQADALMHKMDASGHQCYLVGVDEEKARVFIDSSEVARLSASFGMGDEDRRIPGWVLCLNAKLSHMFLNGFFIGCDHSRNLTTAASVQSDDDGLFIVTNKKVAMSLCILMRRTYGAVASIGMVDGQWFVRATSPHDEKNDGLYGDLGFRVVSSNSTANGCDVYNLSVADDESYVADGVVVHNCQPHSLSGKRMGMRDPRAAAFHQVMEKIIAIEPKVIVFENVPGLISSKDADGERGGALRHIRARMMDAGYTPWYSVMNAYDYGVPQDRSRIFIVGSRDGSMWFPPQQWEARDKLTVYDAFCDILGEEDVDLPNHIFTDHSPEMVERIRDLWEEGRWSLYENFTQSWARLALDLPAPTQTENHGGLCIHPTEPRVITPREMARLQSFSDDFVFEGNKSEVIKQIGNAVPVLLAKAVGESVLSYGMRGF